MKDLIALNCLTPFLESGKKFRLPSGHTYDDLRQSKENSIELEPLD